MNRIVLFSILFLFFAVPSLKSQESFKVNNQEVRDLIDKYKKDPRGPYRDIRWFCNDGTINMPKEPCEEVGGVQRARYKEEVIALGESSHIFLGQILSTTDFEEFWDAQNYFSRMKQYQLEKYLRSVDNGWVNRRGQFYRGAVQVEDEETWGKDFFIWLLEKDDVLSPYFYTIRQAVRDIPHSGDDNMAQKMRSQSKFIADTYDPFMNLRIKIHGSPESSDIDRVREFVAKNDSKLSSDLKAEFKDLVTTMTKYFEPVQVKSLWNYLNAVSSTDIKYEVNKFIEANADASPKHKIEGAAELMWYIRTNIENEKTGAGRLALMDLSIKLEELITKQVNEYPEDNLNDLISKICYLSTASAATGYTEVWEWDQISGALEKTLSEELSLLELENLLLSARKQLEWGTAKNKAVYENVITVYEQFEPLTNGFLDDRIRGSVALPLGNAIGKLGAFISDESSLNNRVLDIPNQSHIHGLNPGYAMGKIVVVEGNTEDLDVSPENIYVFKRPPSDLKPVAGLLTVSEGNLVSHLQLLARNLGIPNAAISDDNFTELKKYDGQKVFYAVSNKGTVIMKPADAADATENALFSREVRSEEMITVPVDRIRLDRTTVIDLKELNAASSGIYCGPKAANLGELKENFPDHVVEGFVIPFGIFLDHMKQNIPGEERTYWDYLNSIFETARSMRNNEADEKKVENYQLEELGKLRTLIIDMPLKEAFITDMENAFTNILGGPVGSIPVFLRSDTNMEDLKNFTGAGLNLTLFNVAEKDAILSGIKTVWASPYTERSFKWRQKLLNNPENVYPSIVVIPGVNNDYSGVMITKGVSSGRTDEITVAFSRGVGGAVEGQVAETWVIRDDGSSQLISPSREPFYKTLPETGGTATNVSAFNEPILNRQNLKDLHDFSKDLVEKMKQKGIDGPYDVELGFKDGKIWLFQVRPFVENKNARSSEYLESITPEINTEKIISLQIKLGK